jgi:hypothetical protein
VRDSNDTLRRYKREATLVAATRGKSVFEPLCHEILCPEL